jgi:hypothetical protein
MRVGAVFVLNYHAFCYRVRVSKAKVSLQTSEGLVFQAAAQIYAAYISAGKVSEGHEHQWMDRAIRDAILLAQTTEKMVQSDSELD